MYLQVWSGVGEVGVVIVEGVVVVGVSAEMGKKTKTIGQAPDDLISQALLIWMVNIKSFQAGLYVK